MFPSSESNRRGRREGAAPGSICIIHYEEMVSAKLCKARESLEVQNVLALVLVMAVVEVVVVITEVIVEKRMVVEGEGGGR